MPGRLFLTRPLSEVASALGLSPDAAPDDPPRRNIQPGQEVITVMHGPAFRKMRWGLIPVGRTNARGRPVMETIVNARSETVFAKSAFQGVGRCVVPADGWYEWTGKKGRKTAWEIRAKDGAILWFAAICDPWTAPGGQEIWQTATVTCPPNAELEKVHDRMGVLLSPADIPTWLDGIDAQAEAILKTVPDGTLRVTKAEGVDWAGP